MHGKGGDFLIKKISISKILISILLLFVCLTIVIPCLNIVARSFSSPDKVHLLQSYDILPKGFSFVNYQVVFSNSRIWTSILNSIFITVLGSLLSILLTTCTAYVLVQKSFMGKKVFMVFLVIIMIIEPGIVQEYLVFKDLKILDNIGLMVIYRAINVYYLIIMMRFIQEIPYSLIESAKIDGAEHLSIFFKIILPLAKIPVLTVGMFYAVFRWNEFFKSSIFLSSPQNTVLQVLLRQFIVESDTTAIVKSTDILANNDIARLDFTSIRATTIVVAVIPILLLYPLILKYYTSGVMTGGVKE